MDQRPGDVRLSEDQLKWTPSTASEMRFGPDGKMRPRARAKPIEDDDEVKQPVNLRRIRNRSQIAFSVVFAVIGVMMVAGALTLLPNPFAGASEPAPTPAAEEAPSDDAEPSRELQGGVKVRKGING